jgi:aryl-alcohol dehydrogenase-like predicted oxidoreductase
MSRIDGSDTYRLGDRDVRRVGYGAMQLAGPGVFGPPKDPGEARAVLREVVASGVNHIDTSDFYGPHVTNQLIREALHPYADDLVIVTKVGAKRDGKGAWLPAASPDELTRAVHDNLRNLKLDVLEVVNLRIHGHGLVGGSIEAPLTVMLELQSSTLSEVAARLDATPMQVAQAWLLQRAPNVLLIPGTSSRAHLRENLAADEIELAEDVLEELDGMAGANAN